MKKMVFFLLVLIPVLFSAVSGSDLEDVQKAGIIQFCVVPDKAPFTFYNDEDELTGIDVELMSEIAERMGLKLEVSEISANDLEEALEIGQADVIGGAFSITQSRKEKIDFTKTYYIADPVFVCKNTLELSEPLKENSFDGKKIGVLKNSGFEEWLRSDLLENGYIQKKDIYTYDDMENAMKALERGRIDLVLTDASLYQTRFQDDSVYHTYTYGSAKDSYAFGLRKGSDLKTEVNNQLVAVLKDGTAQEIADRFFSMDYTDNEPVIQWPGNNSEPTQMPSPTFAMMMQTPTPPPAAVNIPPQTNCSHSMAYVADVTIPDGTAVSAGSTFTKTWRIRNTGNCAWTTDFYFGFVSGSQMGGISKPLPQVVSPGGMIDISVDLTAPVEPGSYTGNWQLKTPQGYGIGTQIWVQIVVSGGYSDPSGAPSFIYPTATPPYAFIATVDHNIFLEPAPTATPFFASGPIYHVMATATPDYLTEIEFGPSFKLVPSATLAISDHFDFEFIATPMKKIGK